MQSRSLFRGSYWSDHVLDLLHELGEIRCEAIEQLTDFPQRVHKKRLIHIELKMHEIFPERVVNPINKQVRSTGLFI